MADSAGLTRRQQAERRVASLLNERSTFVPVWREISENLQPLLGRFLITDHQGKKRHNLIYDRTGIGASRTLGAGLMSGASNPARPWFRLTLPDKDLVKAPAVKAWLHRNTLLLREIFARSNTYRALQQAYEELGLFGTWAGVALPDFDTVLHHYPMTIGEYALGINDKGTADSFCRQWEMTVGQMVKQFGRGNCSTSVQNMYDRHDLDKWVPVTHLVEPNDQHDPSSPLPRAMRWKSCYFEATRGQDKDFLRESGYKRFPVLAPRWAVTGNDVYGHGPGWEALGDVKQLQFNQLRKSQGIDHQTNPAIQVPTAYKGNARARLPGGVMYVDASSPAAGVRRAYEVDINLRDLREDIIDIRERINAAFYADLFLMIANDTRSGTTATEIAERHEEKLLMIGPVLERLHNELYTPLVDMAFDYAVDAKLLSPPPPELEGMDVNIEFVSVLAQAQRMVSAGGVDRLLGTIGSMAGLFPQAANKVIIETAIDDYADMFGVNPEIIRSTEDAQALTEQQQKAAQAAQAAAAMPAAAQTAKAVAGTDVAGLQDVMSQFSGYNYPAPGA